MKDPIRVELAWYKSPDATAPFNYRLYTKIRAWLKNNGVVHNFGWNDTGRYFPDYLVMEAEFATVFKLTFDL